MMRLVIVIAVCIIMTTEGTLFDVSSIINRHNYGYVLRKEGEIHLATAEAKLIIHYKLPQRFNVTRSSLNCSAMGTQARQCEQMSDLLQTARNLRFYTNMYLGRTIDHVYEVIREIPDSNRPQRGLWSAGWSAFTGLAQKSDLDKITRVLQRVEQGMLRAADTWQAGANQFASALSAESDRTDNLERMIELHRQSILSLQEELVPKFQDLQRRGNFLATLLSNYLIPSMYHISEIDELLSSTQILNAGRIPSFFVSYEELKTSIAFLKQKLQRDHPNLRVLIEDLSYYYKVADFHYFRRDRHLFIVVHAPLTVTALIKPLELIRVQRIPLLIPGDNAHYTVMTDDFEFIAYARDCDYYLTFKQKPELRNNLILDLHVNGIHPLNRRTPSCALALIEGNLTEIKQLCQFRIKMTPLVPQFFRLSDDLFFFSNVSHVKIVCPNVGRRAVGYNINRIRNYTILRPQTLQFVHRLNCDCYGLTDNFIVTVASSVCENNNIVIERDIKHVINAPFLSNFLEREILDLIESDTLLNESIPSNLPQLPIASTRYEELLSLEEAASYDLHLAVNHSKSQTKIYKSLGHYLFNKLMVANQETDGEFNFLSGMDYATVFGLVIAILALIACIILHIRLRALYLLAATRIPATHAAAFQLPRVWEYKTTPSMASNLTTTESTGKIWHEHLSDLFPIELTILILIIFLIMSVIGYIIYKRKLIKKYKTKIVLELSSGSVVFSETLMKLPYNAQAYRIEIQPELVGLRLIEGCLTSKLFFTAGVQIINTMIGQTVTQPLEIPVHFCAIRKVRNMLNSEYCVILLVFSASDSLEAIVNVLRPRPSVMPVA